MAKLKDGFYKQIATTLGDNAYVLLAGGGSKAVSDFATISDVVTALGTNGDYVTWTKNGTANNLTVPYATKSGSLVGIYSSALPSNTFDTGAVKYYYNILLNTEGLFPHNNNANSVLTVSKHQGSYLSQLGFSSDRRLYFRSANGEDINSLGWNTIAYVSEIPTKVSQLTNDSGFVTGGPYLPLSGGTMTGSTTVNSSVFPAFVLNNTNSSGVESGIRFEMKGSNKGYVGYHNSYGTYIWNSTASRYLCIADDGKGYLRSTSTAYELIHSGNISSYALTQHQSLANYVTLNTGQTLTGVKTFNAGNVPLKLNSTGNEVGIQFLLNDTAKGWVGYTNTTGAYIYNYPSGKYIGVKDDGTPYYYSGGFNTLLHTGNAPYVRRLYGRNDFEYYVVLLCKYGTALTHTGHRATGKIYSEGGGVGRYVAADVDIWVADWSSGYDSKLRFDTYGTQEMDLVTCTYGGTKYLAIRIQGSQAKTVYFEGTSTEMLFTPIQYYNNNTGAVSNSEIYNSISPVSVSQPYSNGVKYALVSEIPTVTNYYWADQLITSSAKTNTTPTFGSVKATGLITAQSGIQIGSTSDIGWYFYDSRICAGQSVARGVNTGSLLVSNAWADASKVPTNGIYSKGHIITPANVQALNLNLHGDWETDFGIHFNEGGDTKYGFSLLYGDSDLFKLVTRNTGTASTVFSVGRGSTQVDFKGKVTIANRLYPKEWVQFDNATGLYWPYTYGAHFYPNATSTYGQFQLLGSKNSYSGIHFGSSVNYLTVMSTDVHHGLYCESYGWEFYFNRNNSYIGLRTNSTSHPLTINGDSYTNGWSRAADGFYVHDTGVHFTHQGTLGEIDMTSNNEFLWGSSSADLYFNYRAVSRGTTVTHYRWHAGSSSSYATHTLGTLNTYGPVTITYNSYPGLTIHNNTTSGEASMYIKNNTAGWALGVNTWGKGAGVFGIGQYQGTGSSSCRLSIDNNGKVRIGTDSGSETLNVGGWIGTIGDTGWYNSTYAGGMYMQDTTYVRTYNSKALYVSNTGDHAIYTAGGFASSRASGSVFSTYYSGTWYCDTLYNHGNGNLSISAPGGSLFLAYNRGDIYFCGSSYYINRSGYLYAKAYYETSDERLKNFYQDVIVDFNKLKEIPKKYFVWKTRPTELQIGTSAQSVQNIYPELVSKNNNGILNVDYSKLSVIALKAIDELYDMILGLRAENRQLREQIRQMQK